MGNPNMRPKKSSTDSSKSIISAKTLPQKVQELVATGVAVKQTAPRAGGVENVAKVKKEIDPKPMHLSFKSHQTGTLVTNHFEPYPEGLPPALQSVPQTVVNPTKAPTSAKTKGLSATSSVFVPSAQIGGKTEFGGSTYPTAVPATPSPIIQNIQRLIHSFPGQRPADAQQGGSGSNSLVRNTFMDPYPYNNIPFQTQATRTFLDRADRGKKNILITESGVKHNVVLVTEHRFPNGHFSHYSHGHEFHPQVYNFIDALKKMNPSEKERFWSVNFVDITVDLTDIMTAMNEKPGVKGKDNEVIRSKHKIIEQIESLGPEFRAYAKTLYLNLFFPAPAADAIIPKPRDITGAKTSHKWAYPDSTKVVGTPAFALLEEISAMLDTFQNIQRLEIVLQNPRATSTSPFTLEMLYHTLPFYDLHFDGWNIHWQAAFMSKSESVGNFPIILLDKERDNILWEREQKTRNAVFARKSIAPQYNHGGI